MTNSGSQTPAGFYPNPENPSGPNRWWDGQAWTEYYETPAPPPPPGAGASPATASTPSVPTAAPNPAAASSAAAAAPSQPSPAPVAPVQPGVPPQTSSGHHAPTTSSQPERPSYSGIPPLNPKPQPSPSSAAAFPSLGETIGGGWQALIRYWKPLLVICGGLLALPLTVYMFALMRGLDGMTFKPSTFEITAGTGNALVLNFVIFLSALVMVIGGQAVAALLIGADGNGGDRTSFQAAGPAIKRGLVRFPVMLGWSLLLGLAAYLLFFLLALLSLTIPVLGVLLSLVLLIGSVFVYVKFAFIQFAVADGENVPFAKSFNVSKTRFWPVLGHILVLGIIAGVAWIVLSIPTGIMVPVEVVQLSGSETFRFDTSGVGAIGLIAFAIYMTLVLAVGSGVIGGALARMYRGANPAAR